MSKQFGNGDAISYLYDQGKRLTNKEAKNSNNDLINKYVYAYNKVNMKTFEQRGHDSNKSDIYNYDALYRLKDITFNADSPISPTTFHKKKSVNFDKVDNILKIVEQTPTSTHELINTLTGVNAQLNQYTTFDQWGLTHDLNGNTSQKGTQFFTYDYRNQLVKSTDQGTEVTFKYDVLGRRIEKEVSKLQVTSSKKYFYAGNQVIEERDGSDSVLKQFIYGNGIDEILRVDKYESGNPVPYYFHTNDIGSVTAITDNTGNLIERYSYDLYGMPTITDNTGTEIPTSSIDNNYLFHGRRYDKETNLYYYRARYYDPIMGRFLSTDPMGYKDSMNLYQAFGMNGMNYVDPLGELYVRLRLIDRPVKHVWEIPDNPRGKAGVTRPNVRFFRVYWKYIKDKKSGKHYWKPDIHIHLDINIFYLFKSGYTKAHEWRHAEDMIFALAYYIVRDLKKYESETKIFLDETDNLDELKRNEKKVMEFFRTEMKGWIDHSVFQRDALLSPYFFWYDFLQWIVDALRNKDSGKPYRSEYVWRE